MLINLKVRQKKNIVLIYIDTLIISRIPIPLWNVQMNLASYKIMMRTIIQNGS